MRLLHTMFALVMFACAIQMGSAQTHPAITSWIINTTGITGRHYLANNPTPIVDTAKANVQLVRYSNDYSYVSCSGIPSYVIGPYRDGNPSIAVNRNYLFKIPLTPSVQTGAKTAVGLGHIAVLINGVPVYNYADARSYNNQNVWHQNAIVFERTGFDCATGHPAPLQTGPPGQGGGGTVQGQYHHHQNPTAFNIANVKMSDVCDMYLADGLYVPDSSKHGPLIGFAFDGFPIYGAYGWATGTTTVERMRPSYRMRTITERTTLADGTVLPANQVGPTLAVQPLGSYAEDYEYVPGSGDLDEHNGRFCITPEYPEGTYAYFSTIDANGVSAYPYVIGPTYYGIVATENFPVRGPGAGSTNVTINEKVTTYTPASKDPTITITTQAVLTGKVGEPYSYQVKATASVAEQINYNLESAPTGMEINAANGLLTWQEPRVGRHDVIVVASIAHNGKQYTSKQQYSLMIAGVTPVKITFTSQPVMSGREHKPYVYNVKALVSDTSKKLAFSLVDSATGMSLNANSGVLTWTDPLRGTYKVVVRARVVGDTVKADQTFTLVIVPDSTTGVEEQNTLASATVYPNPVNDVLIVQLRAPVTTTASVELIDIAGRVIRQTAIHQGSTMCFIDMQTVYAGAYVVRILHENNSLTLPVVVRE